MDGILQTLHELEGVNGALIADSGGQIVAYRAHAVYDATLLQQVSRAIGTAIDSVKLLHSDWESITAQFSDGRLLIRSISPESRAKGTDFTLSLIADARLNLSFAGVAIRVAVSKLRGLLDAGVTGFVPLSATGGPKSSGAMPVAGTPSPNAVSWPNAPVAAPPAGPPGAPRGSIPDATASGLSWSNPSGPNMAGSGIAAMDAASSAVLNACTRALARSVGPIARRYVKEAVNKMWPDRPFSKDHALALVAELERHLDPADAAQFRKLALQSTV